MNKVRAAKQMAKFFDQLALGRCMTHRLQHPDGTPGHVAVDKLISDWTDLMSKPGVDLIDLVLKIGKSNSQMVDSVLSNREAKAAPGSLCAMREGSMLFGMLLGATLVALAEEDPDLMDDFLAGRTLGGKSNKLHGEYV